MKKKQLLVVDDDPGILDSLQLLLEDAGYEVQTSTKNGEFVESAVQNNPPNLIILDILLSGHDGRTICKKLKSQEKTKHIPIVLMSAHPGAGARASEVGADDFLAKPFEIDELLAIVERLL